MNDNNRLIKAVEIAKHLDKNNSNESIGLKKEKTLHRALKYYVSMNANNHELKIEKKYIDVIVDEHLYEIQTQNFNTIRNKLATLLPKYQLTIIYPIAYVKYIYNIDINGEVAKPKKSPKKTTVFKVFEELYKIKDFLHSDNLTIRVMLFEMDEYRLMVLKRHYRSKGYTRYDQIPTQLIKEYNLKNIQDFQQLLVEYDVPTCFTVKELSRFTKQTIKKTAITTNVLASLGVIHQLGKKGRSNLWTF